MPAEPIPIVTQDNQQQSFPTLSSSHPIFGRWSAFSPRSPPAGTGIGAGSPPSNTSGSSFHDDDDLGDLRNHTWHAAAQRRAASLSMSAGSNFLGSQLGSGSVGSPPTGGPLSDKVALGQGVLRRLSFSSGFGAGSGSSSRPVPPPVPSPPNPTPIGSLKPNDGLAAHPPPPPAADPGVQRAGTIAGSRRRFSESTARRRGVSPMGERLLRDQVHF